MKHTVLTRTLSAPSTSSRRQLVPGALCWAKLSRYPWWPALILERSDVRIPLTERRDTQTAIPVLFFGTGEFSWIDSIRNLSPWQTEKAARSDKDDSVDFELALHEAEVYATEAVLPEAFSPGLGDVPAALEGDSPASSAGLGSMGQMNVFATVTLPPLLSDAEAASLDVLEKRRLAAQRRLGLAAPFNSPFKTHTAHQAALAAFVHPCQSDDMEATQ